MITEEEKFRLEWDNYFDNVDTSIHRLDELAAKALDEGFADLAIKLITTATDLMLHIRACENFLNQQAMLAVHETYKQNPLLKRILESKTTMPLASPFMNMGGDHPDS